MMSVINTFHLIQEKGPGPRSRFVVLTKRNAASTVSNGQSTIWEIIITRPPPPISPHFETLKVVNHNIFLGWCLNFVPNITNHQIICITYLFVPRAHLLSFISFCSKAQNDFILLADVSSHHFWINIWSMFYVNFF